jgi:succinoglycan biosynthesis protein ExoA
MTLTPSGGKSLMENMKDFPAVTVILPARNEEKHIERCLESLLNQSYPQDRVEIIVVDGESDDRTEEKVNVVSKKHPYVRGVKNHKRIIPAALNIGIREAKGDIIVRVDAHTVYDRDYIRKSVALLLVTEASNVGGVIAPVGNGFVSNAIAIGVSSPFGVGNAYHRFARDEMWVDSVPFGCWRKSTLQSLGGYNESYEANEDYELNYRLRMSGGKVLLSPEIKSYYFSRTSLKSLFQQYFRYGQSKVRMLGDHPESLVCRQAVPPMFVSALLLSVLLSYFSILPLVCVFTPYALCNTLISFRISMNRGVQYLPLLPLVFFSIHIAWGSGFLFGIKRFGFPRFRFSLTPKQIGQIFKASRPLAQAPVAPDGKPHPYGVEPHLSRKRD